MRQNVEDEFDDDDLDAEWKHYACNSYPNCDMFPEGCSVRTPGVEREYFGHKG